MTDRAMPANLEAEVAVLGAVLIRNSALDEIAQVLTPTDFYRQAHQRIYRHMLALSEKRQEIDFVTLKESLSRAGELDDIGGAVYLAALVDGLPHATSAAHYARIVRDKASLRQIIHVSLQALERAYEASDDVTAVLDSAQQALFAIATDAGGSGLIAAPVLVSELMATLDALQKSRGPVTGVPTGLADLDYLTAGFQKGDLILLAARPSMGKTALALGMAFHAATTAQRHVAVFSLEMSRSQLGLRLIAAEAQIDGHRMRTGQLWEAEWPRITSALAALNDARLHIDDASTVTLHHVRAQARKMKTTVGLDLLIVDYLQLMEGTKSENRNLEMAGISRALKGLAKDLDIPVIALSQLSRKLEDRSDKRPQLSDLRDSGALEQDADVVIFLYRDEVYNDQTPDRGIAELAVAKARNGPVGMVKVNFEPHTMRFRNLARGVA